MNDTFFAMLFGIAGTVLFHLGKGMQKQGIGFLAVIRRCTVSGSQWKVMTTEEIRSGAIYLAGILFNNSLILWIMLANMYGPPSYFASVFGIGIMALLFHARLFLYETLTRVNYLGMGLLILGTLTLGMEAVRRRELSMSDINFNVLGIIIIIYFVIAVGFIRAVYRSERLYLIGIGFGLFSGGAASLDPVLKGIAQQYGGMPGFFPSTQTGWIIFFASFIFATASFLTTQWGFVKNAPSSVQISVSSSIYVCFPILIQGFALPGFILTQVTYSGMILVTAGILCMMNRSGVYSTGDANVPIIPL